MGTVPDFPTSGAIPQIPTPQIPIPQGSTGSAWTVIFSRPSAWLAAGTLALLILMTCLLATHRIPAEQLDLFKSLETGVLVLFSTMVHSVFNGDGR